MKLSTIARHIFLVCATAFVLLPFIWIVFVAFKPLNEALGYPPTFFPHNPTIGNFVHVLTRYRDVKAQYWNSIVVTAVVVPIVTTITAVAGFCFARLRFPGRDKIFWGVAATMFFPLEFTRLFGIFEITNALDLLDTRLGLILPYLSLNLAMYTFIMRQNFMEITEELEDAARIDGCSIPQIFVYIMLPLVKNGIAVVGVLCFITVWGEYLYALTLTLQKAVTLPVGLTLLAETTGGETDFNILAAAYCLAILPPLALFIASQRLFVKGLEKGALKF